MRKGQKILLGMLFLVIFLVLAVLTGNMPKAFAATTNQTNVTVNVASIAQITVAPTQITWTNVAPGWVGGMVYLDIINSGSQAIQRVYAYADTLTSEPSNPIPTGDPTQFSSGSVVTIRKNETAAGYYYADRLEWNITEVRLGIAGPPGSATSGGDTAITWGYFRNASPGGNYLYYLVNGSAINAAGGCNSTNSKIMIETEADNGTTVTRTPDLGNTVTANVPEWGIYTYTTGPLAGHCVAIHRSCEKILIYRYDRRNFGDTQFEQCDLTNDEQSFRTTVLYAGNRFTINLDAWVPEGTPAGWLKSSWLTVEAGGA